MLGQEAAQSVLQHPSANRQLVQEVAQGGTAPNLALPTHDNLVQDVQDRVLDRGSCPSNKNLGVEGPSFPTYASKVPYDTEVGKRSKAATACLHPSLLSKLDTDLGHTSRLSHTSHLSHTCRLCHTCRLSHTCRLRRTSRVQQTCRGPLPSTCNSASQDLWPSQASSLHERTAQKLPKHHRLQKVQPSAAQCSSHFLPPALMAASRILLPVVMSPKLRLCLDVPCSPVRLLHACPLQFCHLPHAWNLHCPSQRLHLLAPPAD
mmetsp:Transcript_38902/g.68533  ORF Transcript_38902/g.68533 Transcript_38902/m.68533 type:complete len:262 (-) Transcript_38902:343-1128(-)